MRQADHVELVAKASAASIAQTTVDVSDQVLAESDLSSLFGIDIDDTSLKKIDTNQPGLPIKKREIASRKKNMDCLIGILIEVVREKIKNPENRRRTRGEGSHAVYRCCFRFCRHFFVIVWYF